MHPNFTPPDDQSSPSPEVTTPPGVPEQRQPVEDTTPPVQAAAPADTSDEAALADTDAITVAVPDDISDIVGPATEDAAATDEEPAAGVDADAAESAPLVYFRRQPGTLAASGS